MRIIITFLIVSGLASTGLAKELLIVRGDGYYPPFEMMMEGKPTGFHIDIVTSVAARIGLQAKFMTVPWKRAILLVQNGDADAISYMTKTKERSEFVYFHENNILSHIENSFFTLKDRDIKIRYTGDFHQLKPYTIGKLAGYSYGSSFDEISYLMQFYSASKEDQLIKMLIRKRFDIAIGDRARISYIAKQLGYEHMIEFLNPLASRTSQYLAFSKALPHQKLAEEFANEMSRFKESKLFEQLMFKYGIHQGHMNLKRGTFN